MGRGTPAGGGGGLRMASIARRVCPPRIQVPENQCAGRERRHSAGAIVGRMMKWGFSARNRQDVGVAGRVIRQSRSRYVQDVPSAKTSSDRLFDQRGDRIDVCFVDEGAPSVLKSSPEKPNFLLRQMLRIGR